MWSSARQDLTDANWIANHFVPKLPISDQVTPSGWTRARNYKPVDKYCFNSYHTKVQYWRWGKNIEQWRFIILYLQVKNAIQSNNGHLSADECARIGAEADEAEEEGVKENQQGSGKAKGTNWGHCHGFWIYTLLY